MHDLGFLISRGNVGGGNGFSNACSIIGVADTQTRVFNIPSSQLKQSQRSVTKRASSPDHWRRDESHGGAANYGPPSKRARADSPQQRPYYDSEERWRRWRYGSPLGWDRDRNREPTARRKDREKEEEKRVTPNVLSWFVGKLPTSNSFDGMCINIPEKI